MIVVNQDSFNMMMVVSYEDAGVVATALGRVTDEEANNVSLIDGTVGTTDALAILHQFAHAIRVATARSLKKHEGDDMPLATDVVQ